MIKVKIKGKEVIEQITIKGHSGYEESGKDIVCASVSSMVITSVNAIVRIDSEAIKFDESNGVIIDVLKHDEIIDKLILNLIELLEELKKQYPKYIEIRRC